MFLQYVASFVCHSREWLSSTIQFCLVQQICWRGWVRHDADVGQSPREEEGLFCGKEWLPKGWWHAEIFPDKVDFHYLFSAKFHIIGLPLS